MKHPKAILRDMTPALGKPGAPGRWRRVHADSPVQLQSDDWSDATWSFLYKDDTSYVTSSAGPSFRGPEAESREEGEARSPSVPDDVTVVQGPMMKPAVWTWEVPLYFWFGGIAAGSSFVGLACDLTGDPGSARVARALAVATALPCPLLLIMDLGRPARFLNMLRIFKPRSPMSMGAWCLVTFSTVGAAAVGADLLGADRAGRGLGALNALVGGYLGSYTGVLLASTAVPVWARSHLFLGPIFVATATATGASACRLALVATGRRPGDTTREALGRVEAGAMTVELLLSQLNGARLKHLAEPLESGASGRWIQAAKWLVRAGVALRVLRRPAGSRAHHLASASYLAAGLCFRYGWVRAGRVSARDDEAVARMARDRAAQGDQASVVEVTQH